jgi:heme oxygenase (biliverdin-IX-beta and delta-forming)
LPFSGLVFYGESAGPLVILRRGTKKATTMFEQLRHSTKSSHASLEKTFIAKLKALRTTEDYAGLLGTLHDFYAPVEHQVSHFVDNEVLPDFNERRKVQALLQDMEHLNRTHIVRHPPLLPGINNVSTALGALYVIEGSTLGGQIIAGMLNKQLGIDRGLSFFRFYGAETESRWNDFRQCLIKHQTKFDVNELCASAQQTFESMHQWLEKN